MSQPSLDNYVQNAKPDLDHLRSAINTAVIGQGQVIDKLIICLLAGGHILLEGVPGLGKTLLVKALAQAMSGQFGRMWWGIHCMICKQGNGKPEKGRYFVICFLQTKLTVPLPKRNRHS